MTVITLLDIEEWLESCLSAMKVKGRPQREITLQECAVDQVKARIREKDNDKP